MARKATTGGLTKGESTAGVIFFAVYFFVLPFFTDGLFALLSKLFGAPIADSLQTVLQYYLLFAVTLIIFHRFLGKTTKQFFDRLSLSLRTFLLGLVLFYGGNELVYRFTSTLLDSRTNLNDQTIVAQINNAPLTTALIVLLLAPFVEETLFRGLVFGGLKERSRPFAYVLSCALFALVHVWTFAISAWDVSYLVLMLQYLVPGVVFAWVYDHSGTLWTSVLLHSAVNALSLLILS